MDSSVQQALEPETETGRLMLDSADTSLPWSVVMIRDGWRQVAVATAIGFVFFLGLALLIPRRYESVARLMPPDQPSSNSALVNALLSQAGGIGMFGDMLGARSGGATIVGILNSRTIQDDLINQFDLRRVYDKKRYEDTRKILQERSSIAEDKKSGIITIAVQDRSRQRAAQLAKAYIDDLNGKVAQLTTSSAHRERLFLEDRIRKIKQDLDEATLRLGQFSSKNRTLDPQIQGRAMLDAAAALQGQVIAAETEFSGLRQIYGPENVRVKAAGAKVSELRGKLAQMSAGQPSAAGKESSSAEAEPYPSLRQLPLLGNTYYELARTAKVQEAVYEALTKQYELSKVQEAKEIPSIKVLDEPIVPERKAFPPVLLIVISGTFLAFCGALAWVFVRELWLRLPPSHPLRASISELLLSFHQGLRKPAARAAR